MQILSNKISSARNAGTGPVQFQVFQSLRQDLVLQMVSASLAGCVEDATDLGISSVLPVR